MGVLATNVETIFHASGGVWQGIRTRLHRQSLGWDTVSAEVTITQHNALVDAALTSYTAFASEASSAWGSWWAGLSYAQKQDLYAGYLVTPKVQ